MNWKSLLLVQILLIFESSSLRQQDILQILPRARQEMDQVIIQQFMEEKKNDSRIDQRSLIKQFNQFKKQWKIKMVQFLIRELEISQDVADIARKNPEEYNINFQTYKMVSSWAEF